MSNTARRYASPLECSGASPRAARLYDELAAWWPLLDDPADYAEEAGVYGDLLAGACDGPLESLLELGCGGGNSASHLKRRFPRLVLSDISPAMLDVSRARNPDCEHHRGDMRALRLNRTFDAVFIHDAICYMTTESDLRRAMETAWTHCRPGGAALFAPDYVREKFRPGATAGGCDEPAGRGGDGDCPRGLRYLEWVWDPEPSDTQYVADYAFLLRERDGTVRAVHDRHVEGLFPRDRWLALLADVGFEARTAPLVLSDVEPDRHEMFVCRRRR